VRQVSFCASLLLYFSSPQLSRTIHTGSLDCTSGEGTASGWRRSSRARCSRRSSAARAQALPVGAVEVRRLCGAEATEPPGRLPFRHSQEALTRTTVGRTVSGPHGSSASREPQRGQAARGERSLTRSLLHARREGLFCPPHSRRRTRGQIYGALIVSRFPKHTYHVK
jgi:hypothetical protein